VFKEILVAVDNSEPSAAALDLAVELGTAFESSVTVLHVVDPAALAAAAGDAGASAAVEIELDEMQTAGKSLLDEVCGRVRKAGLQATPVLRDGAPAATIIDTAKRSNCDLIVMGTHGRRGVARLFLGSTAEAVLRESDVPVLVKRT
jgi:nucleotide-binding universal stress UspA family protein